MQFSQFVHQVQEQARLGNKEEAMKAIQACLSTLSERIYAGEVKDMYAQLPEELRSMLPDPGRIQLTKYSLSEFLQTVSTREGVPVEEARQHVEAVFQTLRQALSDGEFQDIASNLPKEYAEIFPGAGTHVEH